MLPTPGRYRTSQYAERRPLGHYGYRYRAIGDFVSRHPSIKMLALSFLLVVGVMLVAEGFDHKVPKGYIYFAMAFSVAVEMLNIRMRRRKASPVRLHEPYK